MVRVMTADEKIALKTACVQAAATLIAAWSPIVRPKDVEPSYAELEGHAVTSARVAGVIYTEVSGIDWSVKPKPAPRCGLPR
jgi:hypothetical protein